MPLTALPLSVNGGLSVAPRNAVGNDYSDAVNNCVAPGGTGIILRPGYSRTLAFRLLEALGDTLHHRIIVADGGDAGHNPGSTLFTICDGFDGHVLGGAVYPGGVPYPSDSNNNPNPPHEWMTAPRLLYNCDNLFTSLDINDVIVSVESVAPVLRKDDDPLNGPSYCQFALTTDVTPNSNLMYVNVSGPVAGIVPQEDNAIQFWLYYDGRGGIIPAGKFSILLATENTLGGTIATGLVNQILMPKRWHCITIPLGTRVGTFNLRSIGLKLNSALADDIYEGGSTAVFRLESIYSGQCFFLNRLTSKDEFHFDAIGLNLLFGNANNPWLLYDGSDLMWAGIPAPHLKPNVQPKPTDDVAGQTLTDGSESASWTSLQPDFVKITDSPATAQSVFTDGSNTFTVPGGQAAFVAATNINTNPVSAAGGNYLQLEMTGQPNLGTMAWRNITATLQVNATLYFSLYADFFPSGDLAPADIIFRWDCLSLKFWDDVAATGNVICETPLIPYGLNNAPDGSPISGNGGGSVPVTVTFGNAHSIMRHWFSGVRGRLAGGAVKSISVEFKTSLASTSIYDASDKWRIRLDTVISDPERPSVQEFNLDFTRNTGAGGTVLAQAVIGNLAYKNFGTPEVIAASKYLNVEIGMLGANQSWAGPPFDPQPRVFIWGDTFRIVFNDTAALAGADLTGGGSFGNLPTRMFSYIGSAQVDATVGAPAYPQTATLPTTEITGINSMGIYLLRDIPDNVYDANGRLRISVRIVSVRESTQGNNAEAANFRFCFTRLDPQNFRESDPSPFSDVLSVPAAGVVNLDVSGWRLGMPNGIENRNPDPRRLQQIGVYVNCDQWPLDDRGNFKMALFGYFPEPAGGPGNQIFTISGTQDLLAVGNTGALLKLTNGYPPACRLSATDGTCIAMAAPKQYSVGKVAVVYGSPVISPVDDGDDTPVFDNSVLGLKMRLLIPGAEKTVYTIIHVFNDAGIQKLVISAHFDDLNREWSLSDVAVASDGANFQIYGDKDVIFWTSVQDGVGPAPWAVGILNQDRIGMPGDGVNAIFRVGDYLIVLGRNSCWAYRRNDVIDDFFFAPAYANPNHLSSTPGIISGRALATDSSGNGHWLGRGLIMSGNVAGGFVQNPLSIPLKQFLTGKDGRVSTEGLQFSHAIFDAVNSRYILFLVEPE